MSRWRRDGGALRAGHLLELLLPWSGVRVRDVLLADDVIEEQVQQPVLAADMPVQRGGASVEFLGDAAHGQAVHSLAVKDPQRGLDDHVPVDRVMPAHTMLGPPRVTVTDLDTQRIRRRSVLNGLINEYTPAA